MKNIDIPDEGNSTLDGIKKVMYAPNNSGEFERYKYSSNVEEYCTKLAVEEYEILKEEAIEEIKQNISSPILYYMYTHRMDIPTLAGVTGLFQFRVKRHLKAEHFKKLKNNILQRYADAFQITINDLKDFDVNKI